MKVQASVARCLRTPPSNRYSLKGFHFRCQHRLRGESNLSIVVIRNYKDGLMTVVAEQKHTLYALVDPASPQWLRSR